MSSTTNRLDQLVTAQLPSLSRSLGDVFQRIFLSHVNDHLPEEDRLPSTGYRALQEVDTSKEAATGKGIADIVLRADAAGNRGPRRRPLPIG